MGDKVLATAHSRELVDLGWNKATGNLPAAYLTGYLAGKRAKKSGITECVLDIGLEVPAKGAAVSQRLRAWSTQVLEHSPRKGDTSFRGQL